MKIHDPGPDITDPRDADIGEQTSPPRHEDAGEEFARLERETGECRRKRWEEWLDGFFFSRPEETLFGKLGNWWARLFAVQYPTQKLGGGYVQYEKRR